MKIWDARKDDLGRRRMSALRHYDAELRHLALDFQGWKETRFDMSGKNLSSHQVRATSQQDDLLRLAKFWEIRLLRSHASAKCCKKRQAVNRKCLRRLGGIRWDTWLQSAENLHQFRPSQTVTSVRHYVWCHLRYNRISFCKMTINNNYFYIKRYWNMLIWFLLNFCNFIHKVHLLSGRIPRKCAKLI